MRILKLPWLSHRAEDKTLECYALDVNRAGTKLASGGLDGKVRVWATSSVLQFQEDPAPANSEAEQLSRRMDGPPALLQRPLASMSRHNGVVTSVKFSPDGRFLASGSDDKIVLIWEKDDEQAPRPRQFGEAEADIEHWTVRKRLVAHDNDVQDICWSPDGSLLITVGLDRSIIIWHGTTFERIKRYDIHQSMVKGVVFDPANKFFATASDDRSVRIFRYYKKFNDNVSGSHEFQMEQIVMDPFRKSPLTSYFRRMSWSPDGQHIAVPNATNGPVTSVVIINRGTWATDVSLIGHEAPCEVCAFSPRLYRVSPDSDKYTTVLATGGQDRTLAVWSTALTKPLIVAQDIVRKQITDLAWAPDGQSLYVSSLDGSVTCVVFTENELGVPVSGDAIDSSLERYGGDRDATVMAGSTAQLSLERLSSHSVHEKAPKQAQTPTLAASETFPSQPPAFASPRTAFSPKTGPSSTVSSPKRARKVASVVVTKNGRKRVAPTLISTYSGASGAGQSLGAPFSAAPDALKPFVVPSKLSQTTYSLPKLGVAAAVHGIRLGNEARGGEKPDEDADNDNEDMGFDDPNSSSLQTLTAAGIRAKMKKFRRSLMAKKYPTPFKKISNLPEPLFSNQTMMNAELARLVQSDKVNLAGAELVNTTSLETIDESVYFRVVVNSTKHHFVSENETHEEICSNIESSALSVIEVRNGPAWPEDEEILNTDPVQRTDFQDPTQVIVTNSQSSPERSYILYFPYRIQHAVPILRDMKLTHYVLISFEGLTQIVRAETGSYFIPGFELGSNVVAHRQKGPYFMVLTSLGQIYCWRFPTQENPKFRKILSAVSVAAAVNADTVLPQQNTDSKDAIASISAPVCTDSVSALEIDHDGSPIIMMEKTGSVYKYSQDLMVWTRILDPWYILAYEKDELANMDAASVSKNMLTSVADSKYERVQRAESRSYKFSEKNEELRTCMRTRFEEIVAL
ncbi:hypothetical protein OXX69_003647 [Metschnikowia pulcherrima]